MGAHDLIPADRPAVRTSLVGVLERRYNLLAPLGRGAHGEVWSAYDRVSQQTVAVKLLDATTVDVTASWRREIAALRAAQIPGVVRLLDEGTEGGRAFLVMELVQGTPFAGRPRPSTWDDVAEIYRTLAEIVARIHATGVLHRDLTPKNVLVRGGRPVVLDFSVSRGLLPVAGPSSTTELGTAAYVAPETLMGHAPTVATDLYALGVMFYQQLAGVLPFAGSVWASLGTRCFHDAPTLRSTGAVVPAAIAELIDTLLARDPAQRPASARDVAEALRGRRTLRPGHSLDGARVLGLDELRAMVIGPERIFHIPSEAAELLRARTGGVASRVQAELDRWCHFGLAQRSGAQVVLGRAALDQLQEPVIDLALAPDAGASERVEAHRAAAATLRPGEAGRLQHLLGALGDEPGERLSEALREAIEAARRHLHEGRPGRAMVPMGEAWLTWLRVGAVSSPDVVREFFEVWCEVALLDGTAPCIDRVLYEIARAPRHVPLPDLEALLRCGLLVHTDLARALDHTATMAPFTNRALERLRWDLHLWAARAGPVELGVERVAAAHEWVSRSVDPSDRAAYASWHGWSLYQQNRYEDAADQHLIAASACPLPHGRIAALLSASSALLEGFALRRGAAIAQEAAALAEQCRLPRLEARSQWLLRTARYREAEPLAPDVELVELVATMGVGNLHAMVAAREACVAFRAGDHALAAQLAGDARRVWSSLGRPVLAGMARALALRCGESAGPGEVVALAEATLQGEMPRVALQTLALLGPLDARVVELSAPHLDRLEAHTPPQWRSIRSDILSVEESLVTLRGAAA